MDYITGRLEKEIKEKEKMELHLKDSINIIKDYYYFLEASDKSYTTIKHYINYIEHFIKFCTEEDKKFNYKNINSNMINRYMSSIKYVKDDKGNNIKIGNSIRATRWSALNNFFGYLKSNNLIKENPMDQTFRPSNKKEKKVVYLTQEEIKKCLKNVESNKKNMFVNRDICIISLGISTGLRVSAITQINIEDINFNDNTIKVIEKGNKYRILNFGDNLKNKILKWIEDRKIYYPDIDTNALFISKMRNRISVDAVEELLSKYTKNIDKNITPHKLRATCATNLYKQTKDIYIVANQLGHANIATTKIYTDIDSDAKKKAANILDSLI